MTGPFIVGLDVAKTHDYTVAYIGDVSTEQLVARDRFNGLDYTVAVPRVAAMYREWHCRFIHMDATGVGEAVSDMLRAEGCSVIPFKFTNESKAGLVNTFAREIERGQVILPREDVELRRELELFEAVVMPGGLVRYNAPAGYFDDCVIAAALCVAKMVKNRGMSKSPNRKPYVTFSPDSQQKRAKMPPLPMPKEEAVA